MWTIMELTVKLRRIRVPVIHRKDFLLFLLNVETSNVVIGNYDYTLVIMIIHWWVQAFHGNACNVFSSICGSITAQRAHDVVSTLYFDRKKVATSTTWYRRRTNAVLLTLFQRRPIKVASTWFYKRWIDVDQSTYVESTLIPRPQRYFDVVKVTLIEFAFSTDVILPAGKLESGTRGGFGSRHNILYFKMNKPPEPSPQLYSHHLFYQILLFDDHLIAALR